jgi:hypothetical protein
LLTLDKNIPYQQNLTTNRIALLIVRARSNRIQDLLPVIPECLAALAAFSPGRLSAPVRCHRADAGVANFTVL